MRDEKLSDEPYENNKIPDHWPSSAKRSVVGKIIAVSGLRLLGRGTELIFPRSRSFPRHSIAEITFTNQNGVVPGNTVDSVLYLGFLEVVTGGIIVVGQPVDIGSTEIGKVVGFSDIHEPNHLNILVSGEGGQYKHIMESAMDGTVVTLDIKLNDDVIFGKDAAT
ncbi:MAG: hypothetical protein R6V83_10450 [Candidatus Thorarchaeota archaeon]